MVGEREVWASKLRLLPRDLVLVEWKKMDGRHVMSFGEANPDGVCAMFTAAWKVFFEFEITRPRYLMW